MTAVLHVLHTWGHPSHTFVRALVTGVPGVRPIVVAEDLIGPRPTDLPVHVFGSVRRLPGSLAGKAAVARTCWVGRRAGANLVHAHFAHELLLADRVARLLHLPLVVSLHGRDLLVEVDHRPDALAALRQAAAVVVPSPFLAEAATERGIDPHRIAIIPSGIDPAEIAFRPRGPLAVGQAPLVLFVGRFVEKKGVLDAARAITAVAAHRPVRARFVGLGEMESRLRAELAPLGVAAEVVDGTDRSVVLRSLCQADVLISPSTTGADGDAETLLLVNVEAQAAGVPVLTSDHGGIRNGLGPGAAVVVPEGDLQALTTGLAELLDAPERWGAMGAAGRAHVVEHLTSVLSGERMASLYRSLLSSGGVPAALRPAGSTPGGPK